MKFFNKTARIFYGIGIAGIGIQHFIYMEFRSIIFPRSPSWIYSSAIAACIVGAALVGAGVFIILGRKVKVISLFLGSFLFLLFIFFQCPYVLFIQPNLPYHLGLWPEALTELALSASAFVIAALSANEIAFHKKYLTMLEKVAPLGSTFFSITMVLFGICHFFYTTFVASLVPSWIPDHTFWVYFSGVALIASGVAIILKIRATPVAFLLSSMFFLWAILLHIPRVLANPHSAVEVTMMLEALAYSGVALGIALLSKNENNRTNIIVLKHEPQYEKDTQH